MRWLKVLIALGFVLASVVPVFAQTAASTPEPPVETRNAVESPIIHSIELMGLRHIASAAVLAQLSLRPGDPLDAAKLDHDIRTLARLGWFAAIRVEKISGAPLHPQETEKQERLVLAFYFKEEPILSRVEYSGSRLLSRGQIEKLLEEKKLTPGLGKPADPAALQRIAVAIRSTLNELGHPEASVQVRRQLHENKTVNVQFEIADGPHLLVRRVRFEGDPGFSEKLLLAQIQSIAPWEPFASLRGKDVYTQAAFEEDRQRILKYYQDHGYPEARVGSARLNKSAMRSRKWFPFPHHATQTGLVLSIPVQAGPFYRLESIDASLALQQAIGNQSNKPLLLRVAEQGHPFSQQEIDKLRRFYSAHLLSHNSKSDTASFQEVDANPIFDPERRCAE